MNKILTIGFIILNMSVIHGQQKETVVFYKNNIPVNKTEDWDEKIESITDKNGIQQIKNYNKENKITSIVKKSGSKENPIVEIKNYHPNGFISVSKITTNVIKFQCIDANKMIFFQDKECLVKVKDDDSAININSWIGRNIRRFIKDYPTENLKMMVEFTISPESIITINKIGNLKITKENDSNLKGLFEDIYKAFMSMPKTNYPTTFDLIGNQKIDRKYSIPLDLRAD